MTHKPLIRKLSATKNYNFLVETYKMLQLKMFQLKFQVLRSLKENNVFTFKGMRAHKMAFNTILH